jgi:hypothetical protein
MRELESYTSERNNMINEQIRILDERNEDLDENNSESQSTGSIIDDYANPSLEPGD